jgi:hypothetical protein
VITKPLVTKKVSIIETMVIETMIEHFDCQNHGNQKCDQIILVAKTMVIEQNITIESIFCH